MRAQDMRISQGAGLGLSCHLDASKRDQEEGERGATEPALPGR